jgi:hypothetical protein
MLLAAGSSVYPARWCATVAAGHMMNVTRRYVAGLPKLSGIPIEQLTRERRSDSTQ